ncbi:MAG TPA: TlpA disulfide reductase family protein [Rhodanobacteraceae bacterium]|nr:TlpA disulfide reductase family protein [Rhodanobacteraceae bacterium]
MLQKLLLVLVIACATLGAARAEIVGPRTAPPDLVGVDGNGADVLVSAYRGKVVVLSFWASWCGYCLKELPVLEKIQRVLGKERIKVIAINIDKNRGDYLKMKRQLKNFELTMARDENHVTADQYGANALPFLVMVDRSGLVAHTWKGYPGSKLDVIVEQINGLLDEPVAPKAAGG